MRHFIWYDTNGSLRGVHRHSRGWPDGEDLRDTQATTQKVLKIQERMSREPGFSGFAEYNCLCPSSVFMCTCAHQMLFDHYFDGERIVAKPELLIELGGEVVPTITLVGDNYTDLTPGSTVQLVLKAAVPDGHSVKVSNSPRGVPLLAEDTYLTFDDGVSESVEVLVPDQGLSGIVGGQTNLIRRFAVVVRGWA
jgi:hypothetical protein